MTVSILNFRDYLCNTRDLLINNCIIQCLWHTALMEAEKLAYLIFPKHNFIDRPLCLLLFVHHYCIDNILKRELKKNKSTGTYLIMNERQNFWRVKENIGDVRSQCGKKLKFTIASNAIKRRSYLQMKYSPCSTGNFSLDKWGHVKNRNNWLSICRWIRFNVYFWKIR